MAAKRAAHVAVQALDDAVRLRVVRGRADALDAVLAREHVEHSVELRAVVRDYDRRRAVAAEDVLEERVRHRLRALVHQWNHLGPVREAVNGREHVLVAGRRCQAGLPEIDVHVVPWPLARHGLAELGLRGEACLVRHAPHAPFHHVAGRAVLADPVEAAPQRAAQLGRADVAAKGALVDLRGDCVLQRRRDDRAVRDRQPGLEDVPQPHQHAVVHDEVRGLRPHATAGVFRDRVWALLDVPEYAPAERVRELLAAHVGVVWHRRQLQSRRPLRGSCPRPVREPCGVMAAQPRPRGFHQVRDSPGGMEGF